MAKKKLLAGRAGGVVRTKKSLGPLPTLATAFSRLCDRFHRDCGDRRRFRTRGLLPHHAPPRGLRNYCAMTVDSQIFSWGEVIRPFSARTPQTRSPRTLSTAASILLFASDHRTPRRDLVPTLAVPSRAHSIHSVASSSSPAQKQDLLLDPSPSSRTQAHLLASIPAAYLRSQFIEDSHAPARQPFRSAQHVSEVSPRTPVRLLRVRARPTNRIGIPTRPFSHASRSFRLRSDTRPDSRHHDTDEFPFQASAPSTS